MLAISEMKLLIVMTKLIIAVDFEALSWTWCPPYIYQHAAC